MELHELHVAQLGPRAVGQGVAVGRGDGRVGRLAVELTRAPRSPARRPAPRPGPGLGSGPRQGPPASAVVGDEVDGEAVLPDPDVPARRACWITARMTSRPVASPRAWTIRACEWPPSRVRATWPLTSSKCVPHSINSADPPGRLADDQFDDLGVAEPLAGGEGVGDVVLEVVLGVEHPGDPPLGVGAVALADLVLGHDQHPVRLADAERHPKPRQAAADDQDVGEVVRAGLAGRTRPGSVSARAATWRVVPKHGGTLRRPAHHDVRPRAPRASAGGRGFKAFERLRLLR